MAAFRVGDHWCASADLGSSNIIMEMMPTTVDLVTNVESVSNAWQSKRHPVYKHYAAIDDKYCICLKCKTKLVHGFGPSSLMYHLNTCNKEVHSKVTLHTCITHCLC